MREIDREALQKGNCVQELRYGNCYWSVNELGLVECVKYLPDTERVKNLLESGNFYKTLDEAESVAKRVRQAYRGKENAVTLSRSNKAFEGLDLTKCADRRRIGKLLADHYYEGVTE